MNMKTKLTALLMSILMIVAMIPAFALTVSADDYVAEVTVDGGAPTQYTTFADAWKAAYTNLSANQASVLKLLKSTNMGNDVLDKNATSTYGAHISTALSITIDLNGCVLTAPTQNPHFYVDSGATLTIKDSSPNVEHKYKNVDGLYVWDEKNGDIVIPGGALTGGNNEQPVSSREAGSIGVNKTGKLYIEGGNFIGNSCSTGAGAVRTGGKSNAGIMPTLVISGGLFIGNTGSSSNIRIRSGGHIDATKSSITGGVFVGSTDVGGVLIDDMKINFTTTDETLYGSTGVARVLPFEIVGVQQNADKSAMRLIAEVDETLLTGATEAGFKVSLTVGTGAHGDVKALQSAYYYTKLLAQDDVDTEKMTVIEPTEEGRVLIAVVITDIPVDASARTFTVNPYFVKDGVTYKINTAYNVTIAAVTGQASVSVAE